MGPGIRYGLLAALTLVLASGLVWDRLHPAVGDRLLRREPHPDRDTVRIRIGGPQPAPPAGLPGGGALAPAPPPLPQGPPPAGDPTPEDPSTTHAAAPATCTVVPGDTLGALALRHLGSSRRAAELARANGMEISTPLRVGAVLRLPSPAGTEPPPATAGSPGAPRTPSSAAPSRSHTVVSGDSLSRIARRYYGPGADYRPLCKANGISADAVLRPGQVLSIP